MSLVIISTRKSRQTLRLTYQFIERKFGVSIADEFLQKVDRTVALIAEQPFMFKASTIDINVRIALVTPQSSLYYRVTDNEIHLLFFWNNRQDPILL